MKSAPENLHIQGIVTVRSYPAGTIEIIEANHAAGMHEAAERLFKSGKVESVSHNIVVDSSSRGIDLLRQWFISGVVGFTAYPVGPQWGDIGTGSTTPTTSDTALGTPIARAAISYGSNSAGTAALQFYFSDAQLSNSTYREFGCFVGGTSSTSSGQMVNHALFGSPYTKSSGNDTTVEVDFTIHN